ncbi:MAG: hypothetical protein PHQ40_14620 [Anaerolineaceae bacterium]|nr:hypothetical protein [Anaerolineaceae bacterium]
MDNQKRWTLRQGQLRQFLTTTVHFEQAIQLFLQQQCHSFLHLNQACRIRAKLGL